MKKTHKRSKTQKLYLRITNKSFEFELFDRFL